MNRLGYPRKNFWISKTVTLIYSKRDQDLMKAPDYGTKNVDKLLDDQITTRRAKKPKFIKKNITEHSLSCKAFVTVLWKLIRCF